MTELQSHQLRWKNCTACELCHGRRRVVFFRGPHKGWTIPAEVCFVGEAPGSAEDLDGIPFVGPAGLLLDDIIERAMAQLDRRPTYVLYNLVGCFPKAQKYTDNHQPPPEAIKACAPKLVEFVRICRPRLIVLVGALAKRWVTGASHFRLDNKDEGLEWIPEGDHLRFEEIIHPAAILKMTKAAQPFQIQKSVARLAEALGAIQ